MNSIDSAEMLRNWTFLLSTMTVVALGWVTSKERVNLSPRALKLSLYSFCLSILCGVLVMCVLPGAAESRSTGDIYESIGNLYPLWFFKIRVKLVSVCWPQHVFFMCGIVAYVVAAANSRAASKSADQS